MKLRRLATYVGGTAFGALALTGVLTTQALGDNGWTQDAAPKHQHSSSEIKGAANELVRVVREATARYRDVEVAKADDYALVFGCVTGPDYGAMGLHYVNGDLLNDGKLDATRPEIVIYEPLPNGRLRLIGADYLVDAKAWHAANGPATPQLFGQLLHYFGSPNRFGLEPFYTLHVWAWKDNPSGTFTNWHSTVSCDAFKGEAP
jgi:hypothetical protein